MLAMSLPSGPGSGVAADAGMRATSASDAARVRIHPTLLRTSEDAPDTQVTVHAYVMDGTDLSAYIPDGLTRAWASPNGITAITGTLKARDAVKAAGVEGVIAIEPARGAYEPSSQPADGSPAMYLDGDLVDNMARAVQRQREPGITAGQEQAAETDTEPTGWGDVLNTHHSTLAWEAGFTGAGVAVMANDSGIDFAHPDLIGRWATVDNPDSPYAGWPMQFDANSMYLFARDMVLGEANIASGNGHYADTSTVVTAEDATYQPLDADEPRGFIVTGTSQSGEYHIGTHPDISLRPWSFIVRGEEPPLIEVEGVEQFDPTAGERPAVLVVDEQAAGVYDTVYVDLDFDNDFSDEKPATKESPVSAADWWGAYDPALEDFAPEPDGYYDISGGLVYWVSDGVNPVPASDWWWGLGIAGNGAADEGEPGNGNLVLFSVNDYLQSPAGNHGQLVASAIAAGGVIDGDSMDMALESEKIGGISPPYKPADAGGMVWGAGQDVKLVSAGDFYSYGGVDAFVFAALGYDGIPGTLDDVQIINNSWGSSAVHNDGWDPSSRIIDALTRTVNPTLLVIFAVGNGAPGFGTVTSPAPPSGLNVGASTEHGSTGWDLVTEENLQNGGPSPAPGADQITYGDVSSFSGRGPGARGTAGVQIVASGSRASGDVPVNEALSGVNAWTTWGGTSRSAPVVAGNAALVYQAFRDTFGFWPNYEIMKMLLMSGATDLNSDAFLQGAGSVNAIRSVNLATGDGGTFVWPYEWRVGDYHGENWSGFANITHPGTTYEQWFQVSNPTDQTIHLTVNDHWVQKVGEWEEEWTSAPIDQEPITLVDGEPNETEIDWDTPHYLWDVSEHVPDDADMVVFRVNYDQAHFDPASSFQWEQTNAWYLLGYDWTDLNGDGNLWVDADGDGIVDYGEIDHGEYLRTEYANNRANNLTLTVQTPDERLHDGLFLGLQHSQARPDVPRTPMTIHMDFYKRVDMPWMTVDSFGHALSQTSEGGQLSVPALSTGRIKVTVDVPGDAPVGLYEAGLTFSDGFRDTNVPVVINVASNRHNINAGAQDLNPYDSAAYYNNNEVYGAQSWRWRPESGDWRFYFADLPPDPGLFESKMPDGSYYYLADVEWGQLPTDVDAHIFSPALDEFSEGEFPYFGPYTLVPSASSNLAYVGEGIYLPNTTSGANREIIAAPYAPGLNAVALHNTNYSGQAPAEEVSLNTGVLGVSESPIVVNTQPGDSYSIEVSVMSSLDLSGLTVEGFGLSTPDVQTGVPILQDNPNDPTTASFSQTISLEHAGLLDIQTTGAEGDDIDLFLLYDFNGDGAFDFNTELISASTTPTAEESIRILLPLDGDYQLLVHGWAIPAGESAFDLLINAVQGNAIQTSNAPEGQISPNRLYTFNVDFDTTGLAPGSYTGVITLGPPEGPSAVQVFVEYMIE